MQRHSCPCFVSDFQKTGVKGPVDAKEKLLSEKITYVVYRQLLSIFTCPALCTPFKHQTNNNFLLVLFGLKCE